MVISEMNRLIAEEAINSRINHARLVNGVLGTLIISTSHAQSQRICSCLIARVLALSLSRGPTTVPLYRRERVFGDTERDLYCMSVDSLGP